MANDLSHTPAPPAEDLAASLQRWHPTLAGSLESEDALPFLRPDEAQRLQRIIAPHVEPASEDDLLMALIWLASVTTGDKLRDPDMMRASARSRAAESAPGALRITSCAWLRSVGVRGAGRLLGASIRSRA